MYFRELLHLYSRVCVDKLHTYVGDEQRPCVNGKAKADGTELTLGSFDLLAALRPKPFVCLRQRDGCHSICATSRNPRRYSASMSSATEGIEGCAKSCAEKTNEALKG